MFCSSHIRTLFPSHLCSQYVSWTNSPNNTLTSCSMRNMYLFKSHISLTWCFNFTCWIWFAMIWNIANSSLSYSITKSLISYNKWAKNVDLSPNFKSMCTCRPFWLICLSKYNVLMVNSVFHPFFIKPPHFLLESHVSLWQIFDGITFPLMSKFLDTHCDFV